MTRVPSGFWSRKRDWLNCVENERRGWEGVGEGLQRASVCTPKLSSGWGRGLEAWDDPGLHVKTWGCGGKYRDTCSPGILFPTEILETWKPYSEAWQDYWWADTWSTMVFPNIWALTCNMPPVERERSKGEGRHCIWNKDETECGHGKPKKVNWGRLNGETAVVQITYGHFQPTRSSPKRMTEFLTIDIRIKISCTVDLTMPEAIPSLLTSLCVTTAKQAKL